MLGVLHAGKVPQELPKLFSGVPVTESKTKTKQTTKHLKTIMNAPLTPIKTWVTLLTWSWWLGNCRLNCAWPVNCISIVMCSLSLTLVIARCTTHWRLQLQQNNNNNISTAAATTSDICSCPMWVSCWWVVFECALALQSYSRIWQKEILQKTALHKRINKLTEQVSVCVCACNR